MSTMTRDTVDALLPPGTTVEDLSEHELGELFETVVAQAEAEAEAEEGTSAPCPAALPGD